MQTEEGGREGEREGGRVGRGRDWREVLEEVMFSLEHDGHDGGNDGWTQCKPARNHQHLLTRAGVGNATLATIHGMAVTI